MTTDDESPDDRDETETKLTEAELLDAMEPFEPYTTDEIATDRDAPKNRIRALLDSLTGSGRVRKKELKSAPAIWIREPPAESCPDCGYRFEVKFLHPVLSSVKFCPRCGKQM